MNACKSCGSVLEAEPVELVVPVAAGALGVVVVVVVVVVVAGVVVAGVLDVPVLAAAPAGCVVTNCSRAASSAEYSLPPPWTPLGPEFESSSAGPFLKDDWGVPSKDERLMVVALDTALVDILRSLLEIARRRGVGARK
jgi:hypothetical protein